MRRLLLIALVISAVILVGCSSSTPTGGFVHKNPGIKASSDAENICWDSDDGINERVKGTVTGILNGEEYEIEDKCIKRDYVIEYYCEDNIYKNKNFVCQCSDGACHD